MPSRRSRHLMQADVHRKSKPLFAAIAAPAAVDLAPPSWNPFSLVGNRTAIHAQVAAKVTTDQCLQ